MIIVAGTIRIPHEKIDRYRSLAETVITASRAESGCQVYSFAEDVLQPGLIRIFEIWDSRDQLAAHFRSAHMQPWRSGLAEIGAYDRNLRTFDAQEGAQV